MMSDVQRAVLAVIQFRKKGDADQTTCIFSRAFLSRNKNSKESFFKSLEELDKSSSEAETEGDHENVSCYYSASHTDNVSTDEHDSLREIKEPAVLLKELHISDSGTDLSEHVQCEDVDARWQKFWSENGEKLIWESWINKYSAFINPTYLNYGKSSDSKEASGSNTDPSKPERFSFEEKDVKSLTESGSNGDSDKPVRVPLLTRFLSTSDEKISTDVSEGWNPLSPLSVDCETEAERLLSSRCGSHTSSRSHRTVDSMTNVTRVTVSSLDFIHSSSSDSISTVSSVPSSDNSDPSDEDYQSQWNDLWRDHYEKEYLFHYNDFKSRIAESNDNGSDSETVVTLGDLIEGLKMAKVDDDVEQSTMKALGLPTAFGSAPKRFGRKPDSFTSSMLPSFEVGRQKIKAAMDLIQATFQECPGEHMTGEVEYRTKHIRHQNKHLKFGREPTHIYFDDDGNPEDSKEEAESTALIEEQASDDAPSETSDKSQPEPTESAEATDTVLPPKRKKKKKKRYPPEIVKNSSIRKFWYNRFSLFSKFDEGIMLDEESWYSVSPECVAKNVAERCSCDVIVDAFCGAGGNAIQFALTCNRVIAIDIDPKKIELAQNNAQVYGVADKIDFIVGDFLSLAQDLRADAVFLSPPWGGPAYVKDAHYDLETMLLPVGFSKLFATASLISKNIAAFLPKNSNTFPLVMCAGPGGKMEIQQDFINSKQISITAYYNDLIKK